MKRRAGFTLIEILIVVGIICVMLAVAVASVASGRDAARARAAARGVAQMSHYASALAILRQRSAVISFSGDSITVQLSGEGVDKSEVGELVAPIYQEVDGETVSMPTDVSLDNVGDSTGGQTGENGSKSKKKSGYLYTEDVLDLDELAKEDATRSYEGILFRVELVDEDGKALDKVTAVQLRSEADALISRRGIFGAAGSSDSGDVDLDAKDDEEKPEIRPENEGRVIYETNGNCAPYRVTLFAATEDGEEGEELMTVNVSRTGKVTIGDDEEEGRKRRR
jgi:prepilin-type N-terminal cleavage/methylation domain-containing protein